MTDDTRLDVADAIPPDALTPLAREALIVLGLLAFVLAGSILPGAGRELPGTAVSIGDLAVGVGTLGIVASLLYAAPKVRDFLRTVLEGPGRIVADAASIGQHLVTFLAVLIAHQGFAPVLLPLIDADWVYDVAFLGIALVPVGLIAFHLHRSLDPIAERLAAAALDARVSRSNEPGIPGDGEG